MFHVKHHIKIRQSWLQTTSRRQLKSFSVQQFFKNAAEVWASSPHLRSKSKLHYEIKQTSKKQSEKSQLPLKSKGCNEIQGFRGNCDSQGKLGMSPALPNRFRVVSLGATSLRENGLLYPAKGGSTPAFACQRAAIAPLLCLNLQSYFSLVSDCEFLSFQKCNCSRKNRLQN